jgi:hypothetical protein
MVREAYEITKGACIHLRSPTGCLEYHVLGTLVLATSTITKACCGSCASHASAAHSECYILHATRAEDATPDHMCATLGRQGAHCRPAVSADLQRPRKRYHLQ